MQCVPGHFKKIIISHDALYCVFVQIEEMSLIAEVSSTMRLDYE